MFKHLRIFLMALVPVFVLLSISFAEDLTITTYYPSPYGSYNALTVGGSTGSGAKLEVDSTSGDIALFYSSQVGNDIPVRFKTNSGTSSVGLVLDNSNTNKAAGMRIQPTGELTFNTGLTSGGTLTNALEKVRIDTTGKVGIGTTAPAYALEVIGQIRMSGTAGTKQVVADVAEVIPVADDVEEGDVVCIDNTVKTYQFAKSKTPDSLLVVGVISSTKNNSKSIPALFIGSSEQKQKDNPHQKYKYLAIAGQIAVKACLEGGPIKKGDLLTTSSVAGYAMKSKEKKVGTTIGKALEDFDGKGGDKGAIIALLNLM